MLMHCRPSWNRLRTTPRITGHPPGPSDAFSALTTLPPGLDAANKHAIGLWEVGELLAFADVLFGYPDPEVIYVGLLIARRVHRGKGLGHELHDAILQRALEEPAFTRMRLGIVQTNAKIAEPFWRRRGYRPTGEQKPYRYDHLTSSVTLWERPITETLDER